MARVSNWNPQRFDGEFMNASMDRLRKAARLLADNVRSECPVGTMSRPMYRRGPYAGLSWTRRDAGALKKTVRVTEKKETGALIAIIGKQKSVRVYAGNYIVYYAKIVEYVVKPFMKNAINKSKSQIRSILENG